MNDAARLTTDAWLLRGISSIPGQLTLARGRISFVALGTGSAWKWQLTRLEHATGIPGLADRIDAGQKVTMFDVALTRVDVWFPWYYFTGGLKVRVEGTLFRFSFGRPASTRLTVVGAIDELNEIRNMRRSGKIWKAALARARHLNAHR